MLNWKGTTQKSGSYVKLSSAQFGWDCVVSEEDFFKFHPPFFLFLPWRPSWWKSGSPDTFWKGAIQGSFHKSLVAIGPVVSEEKIFMWISHRVQLSSAVGAILVKGTNRLTYFWKRTIQWLFHQNFVLIEQMVSDKKIFMGISHSPMLN